MPSRAAALPAPCCGVQASPTRACVWRADTCLREWERLAAAGIVNAQSTGQAEWSKVRRRAGAADGGWIYGPQEEEGVRCSGGSA